MVRVLGLLEVTHNICAVLQGLAALKRRYDDGDCLWGSLWFKPSGRPSFELLQAAAVVGVAHSQYALTATCAVTVAVTLCAVTCCISLLL